MSSDEVKEFVEETLRASNPNATSEQGAAGSMGVSSERVGTDGRTDGFKDTRETEVDSGLPEQAPGNAEENPVGIPPKAATTEREPRPGG
ncbi:MAG: hypothetical protein V9G04_12945 [Nocardioides sp.]|jgi:hypothetical protein